MLHPDLAVDDATRLRFRHEAIAAARLSHPNIVATYDTGEDDGVAYIVMELVDGPTLRHLIDEHDGLPVADVIRIGKQVADALDAAHRAGLVHRDVKPANVLVPPAGPVKVTDFGIAKARGQRRPHPHRHRDRHRAVPRTRAGQRASDRPPHRRVRGRAPPLRDARRPPAVRRRHRHRHRDRPAHHLGAGRAFGPAGGVPGPRRRDPPLPRAPAGRPLRFGGGGARRARPCPARPDRSDPPPRRTHAGRRCSARRHRPHPSPPGGGAVRGGTAPAVLGLALVLPGADRGGRRGRTSPTCS